MGRQPTKIPALVNTGEVLDFAFNPFDPHMIAAACDDSYVRVWKIPPGGITEDTSEPALKLSGILLFSCPAFFSFLFFFFLINNIFPQATAIV